MMIVKKEILNELTVKIDDIVTRCLEQNKKIFIHINPVTGEIVTYSHEITPYLGFIELIINWDVVKHYHLLSPKWRIAFYKKTLLRILET
jgi:hypothetical protein